MPRGLAAKFLNCGNHAFPIDTWNRRLAGRVNIENNDAIGVGKGRSELFQEVAGAGIALRLEDNVDSLESALARRFERSADLSGEMSIIVAHADIATASL